MKIKVDYRAPLGEGEHIHSVIYSAKEYRINEKFLEVTLNDDKGNVVVYHPYSTLVTVTVEEELDATP